MDTKDLRNLTAKGAYSPEQVDDIVDRIRSGNSLLFVGAGFSIGSENRNGEQPPLANDLSRAICRLGGFEENDNLAFSADFFLARQEDAHSRLIDFLRDLS
ncbi:MAG: hypothetical protein RLN85_20770, partial [Pseudomonadales bacterium]